MWYWQVIWYGGFNMIATLCLCWLQSLHMSLSHYEQSFCSICVSVNACHIALTKPPAMLLPANSFRWFGVIALCFPLVCYVVSVCSVLRVCSYLLRVASQDVLVNNSSDVCIKTYMFLVICSSRDLLWIVMCRLPTYGLTYHSNISFLCLVVTHAFPLIVLET